MSLAHISWVIICLLFAWKFTAAIVCLSVQKEVSIPHLRFRATDAKMGRLLGSDLPKEETFDIRVTRHLTRSHSKKKYLHPESAGQYRHICQKVAFDYFPTEGYGEYEISLRVLRFPIGNGTYENIITSV